MVLASLFAALACVAAIITRFLPVEMVPFSLLPVVVFTAGGLLGARAASMSMLVYLLLGLAGIPVFSSPPYGGAAYVLKPTFGFILSYVGAAYVIGCILKPNQRYSLPRITTAMLAGLAVIYIIGMPYFYVVMNFYAGQMTTPLAVLALFLPFLGTDLIKLGIAAVISKKVADRLAAAGKRG